MAADPRESILSRQSTTQKATFQLQQSAKSAGKKDKKHNAQASAQQDFEQLAPDSRDMKTERRQKKKDRSRQEGRSQDRDRRHRREPNRDKPKESQEANPQQML